MVPTRLTDAVLNEPVADHARREFTTLYPQWTVGQALDHMRQYPPPGRIIYFYVVDDGMRLLGVVPTRRLLLSPADATVSSIMIREVVSIPAEATVLEACEFFTMHRLLAFPVVGEGKRLLGTVDIELYATELAETGGEPDHASHLEREEMFQLIGVRLTKAQQADPLRAFRGRFPWLLCNVAGGTLAAALCEAYHVQLNWNQAVLALFIPVVLALAESVSIQSVTLALDTLHGGRAVTWGDLLRRLRFEAATGLLLGAATGLVVAVLALVWKQMAVLFLILLGGIGVGVTCAAAVGLAVPYVLRLLRRNPSLAAGPIALTLADMLTLLAYFNLARWLAA